MSSAPERTPPLVNASLAEVKDTLRRLVEENAGIPAASIEDDSSIEGDLAMDSFSFVSLQVSVEESFGVECTPEEIEERQTFDGIARLILEKTSGEGARPKPSAPILLDEHRRGPVRRP